MWLNLKITLKTSPEWNDEEILLSIIDYIDKLRICKYTNMEERKNIFFCCNALPLFKYSNVHLLKIRTVFYITIIQPSLLGNQHSYNAMFQFRDIPVILPPSHECIFSISSPATCPGNSCLWFSCFIILQSERVA